MKELGRARCKPAKPSKEAAPEGRQDYWDSTAVAFKFARRLNIVSVDIMGRFRGYYVPAICSDYRDPLRSGGVNLGNDPPL